jgi:hypothetical protein
MLTNEEYQTKAQSKPRTRIKVQAGEYYYSPDGDIVYHLTKDFYGTWSDRINGVSHDSLTKLINEINNMHEKPIWATELTEFSEIIEAANQIIDMSQVTIEVWNITPQEAATLKNEADPKRKCYGINGEYFVDTKTIVLYYEGVKSRAQRQFTLAHEIGHAIHRIVEPKSSEWTKEEREETADTLGMMLEEMADNS